MGHGAHIQHRAKYDKQVFLKGFTSLVAAGALGCALASTSTVKYPWVCMYVVLNVAV